jgi:hypothetical protein
MKAEQLITSVYVALGILFAFVSNYITKSLSNVIIAILIPIIFYAVTVGPLFKLGKLHKRKMLVSSSIVTFFCVWIVAWIILFNF